MNNRFISKTVSSMALLMASACHGTLSITKFDDKQPIETINALGIDQLTQESPVIPDESMPEQLPANDVEENDIMQTLVNKAQAEQLARNLFQIKVLDNEKNLSEMVDATKELVGTMMGLLTTKGVVREAAEEVFEEALDNILSSFEEEITIGALLAKTEAEVNYGMKVYVRGEVDDEASIQTFLKRIEGLVKEIQAIGEDEITIELLKVGVDVSAEQPTALIEKPYIVNGQPYAGRGGV